MLLHRVSRALRDPQDELWLSLDLSMAQLKILFALHFHGPTTIGALAERVGVKLPTISVTIDRLEHNGYVERQPSGEDRRVVICQLTPEGTRLIERLREERRARIDQVVTRLSDVEVRRLRESLEPVMQALTELRANSQHVTASSTGGGSSP